MIVFNKIKEITTKLSIVNSCERINTKDENFKFYKCKIETPNSFCFSYGVDSSKSRARKKSFLEGIERYCIDFNKENKKRMLLDSYSRIKENAIDPQILFPFLKSQYNQKGFKYKKPDNASKIYWVKGSRLSNKEKIYIPASSVYCDYQFSKFEKKIGRSTSNGCAIGQGLNNAVLNGILELIERDIVLVGWFNKLSSPRISIDSMSHQLKTILKSVENNYQVKVIISSYKSDFQIPVVSILLIGDKIPYFTFGSAADFSIKKAIIKALQESLLIREELKNLRISSFKYKDLNKIQNLYQHAEFYAININQGIFDFLINSPVINYKEYKKNEFSYKNTIDKLTYLKDSCEKTKKDVFFIDLSLDIVKKVGLRVVRVLIPRLQSLNSEYNCRYLGNPRIHTFSNKDPHPIG